MPTNAISFFDYHMQRRKEPCSHIRSLSKEAVLKSTTAELPPHCHIHQNIPTYYICLHCAAPLCLQFQAEQSCLQYHYFCHPTHLFCLQIEQGAVWCHSCNDTIQNQLFDYGPDDKEEGVLKLRRFEKYIADLWQEMLKKSNVKPIGSSHRGIKNLGNTCFLSVVLQSFYATMPLRELYGRVDVKEERMALNERTVSKQIEYFYDDVITKHESQKWSIVSNKKERTKQESKKPFTSTIKNAKFNILIRDFLQNMSNSQEGPLIPTKILNAISQFNAKYHENKEQDAEQLLLLILDAMNQGERINFLRDLQRYKQIQGILGFQKLTPIQNIFSFYLLNEIQCSSCKEVSRSLNLAYSIPLAVDGDRQAVSSEHPTGRVTIDFWQELSYPQNMKCCPLIAPFFDTERLCKANNYYQCQKCRSLVAYRRYYLVSEPKVLMLSFKRFNAKLQKKAVRVEFPLEMTLEGVSLDGSHGKYSLYAVIVHEGDSIATGHYICFIRLEDQWFLCSDQKVQRVSYKEVLSQQPYVLLYQRQ